MNNIDISTKVNCRLLYAMHNIFDRAAARANKRIGDTPAEKENVVFVNDGSYKCIHLAPMRFVSMLGAVLDHQKIEPHKNKRKPKFLDIGCGVGEKIYLASLFGLNTFGLELRKELITDGRKLLKSMSDDFYDDHFIPGNALTFDYKDFDILYFYCPLADEALQIKLELRIAKTAKPGAIVIPALSKGCFRNWGDNTYYAQDTDYYAKQKSTLPKGWKVIVNAKNIDAFHFVREA